MTVKPPPRSSRLLGLGLLAVAFLVAPEPSTAQEPGPGTGQAFAESVDVQVVNVEVRVTDRKGRPVTGLGREDFELYEDGRRVEIEYFAEYRMGRESAEEAPPVPRPEIPVALPPVTLRPPTELRYFVVFLDLDHLTPGSLQRVLPDLEEFTAEVLGPGDRAMVAVRQNNLRVALDFTDDRERLAQTLEEVGRTAPGGLQRRIDRAQLWRRLGQILGEDGDGQSCGEIESYSAEGVVNEYAGLVRNQVQGTVSALTSLVRALVGLPGPKVVLYVGEGLEQRPAIDLYHRLIELCPVRERDLQAHLLGDDLSTSFQRLTADANANRVTFYTLDAGGLRSDASVEVAGPNLRLTALGQRIRTANLQHPLFLMADETGGEAVFNTNRFGEELEEISRDVETYYSLGFVPTHQGDGRVHYIGVEVKADHHDVRHRVAYRDKPLDERIVESMLGTLLFGVEANPLGVEVEAGDPSPGAAGTSVVPVRIRVPLDSLVFTPGAGFSVGQLRLVLVALDPQGQWTPVKQQEAFFKVPEGQDPRQVPREFEVAMELPPGENVVAVGVRDEVGGEASYVRQAVRVPPGP